MRPHGLGLIPAVVVALAMATAGCGGGDDDTSSPATDAPAPEVTDAPAPDPTDPPAPEPTDPPAPEPTDPPAPEPTDPPTPEPTGPPTSEAVELSIEAVDNESFSTSQLKAPSGAEVTLTFNNKDESSGEPHNWHLLSEPGETDPEVVTTPLKLGPDKSSVTFTITIPGEYDYVCDTHLEAMAGVLIVG